jgi:hypothetical protein
MTAEPMPPPAHIAAIPIRPPPVRRKSWINVVRIRAPDAPTGWPRLQPLPLTLTVASSSPSSSADGDRNGCEGFVDLGALEGGSDGCATRGNDDCVRHFSTAFTGVGTLSDMHVW